MTNARALRLAHLAALGRCWAHMLRTAGTPLLAITAERWADAVDDLALAEAGVVVIEPIDNVVRFPARRAS